jgi:lysine-specific demethylase/histidyl-hydroxylase NO66
MSRAARKRAKKKQKRELHKSCDDSDPELQVTKKQKNEAFDYDSDPEDLDLPVVENGKLGQENETIPDEPDEEVDQLVEGLICKLTPSQILLHSEVDEETAGEKVGSEDVDLRDLLQEITAKQRARCLFQSILGQSVNSQEFYSKYWEREPLLIQSNSRARFNGFLSLESIKELTKTHKMIYGRDLNVTRYEAGADGVKRRIILDQLKEGDFVVVADPNDLWSNFHDNGCTIRLLCPQLYSDSIHAILSTLELEWGCMVGANAYLTPPRACQGFSPHYDDIDAYILQLEGKKHWKVYSPLSKAGILPRVSSEDYTEDDLKGVEPVMDVVLEAGDVLYMPRGWIHQACTLQTDEHSLHLTVSAMQQWAWVDYLELLLPEALAAAVASETSTSLREGLPRNFLDYMGAIYDQPEDPEAFKVIKDNTEEDAETVRRRMKKEQLRKSFAEEATKRLMRVTKEAISMIDAACDQMGKRFLSDRQPPALTQAESELTSEKHGGGKILPTTMCRLVRPGIARMALEDGKAVVYHCAENSRVYHGNPLSPLEFEMDDAAAIEGLLTTVEPYWIMVKDLFHDEISDKIEIAQSLYNEGILAILQTGKSEK